MEELNTIDPAFREEVLEFWVKINFNLKKPPIFRDMFLT